MPYLVFAPLTISNKSGSKNHSLNLNEYRNAHFHTLNDMKVRFKEYIMDQLLKLPKIQEPVVLVYRLFFQTKRRYDVANVSSIVDKFFSDALVEAGVIEDDNYDFVPRVLYEFGGIDKTNPRAEIMIIPQSQIQKEQDPMQVTLDHGEIVQAITSYVQQSLKDGHTVTFVDLIAGRGENGYRATFDVTENSLPGSEQPKRLTATVETTEASQDAPDASDEADDPDAPEPLSDAPTTASGATEETPSSDTEDKPQEVAQDKPQTTERQPTTSLFSTGPTSSQNQEEEGDEDDEEGEGEDQGEDQGSDEPDVSAQGRDPEEDQNQEEGEESSPPEATNSMEDVAPKKEKPASIFNFD